LHHSIERINAKRLEFEVELVSKLVVLFKRNVEQFRKNLEALSNRLASPLLDLGQSCEDSKKCANRFGSRNRLEAIVRKVLNILKQNNNTARLRHHQQLLVLISICVLNSSALLTFQKAIMNWRKKRDLRRCDFRGDRALQIINAVAFYEP
jgi:hypothetical protein